MLKLFNALVILLVTGATLRADTFVFGTPSGYNITDPSTGASYNEAVEVDVSVQSANRLLITLYNQESNPLAIQQAINALTFDFAAPYSSLGPVSFTSSAWDVTIENKKKYTVSSAASPTNWYTAAAAVVGNSGLTSFELCDFANTAIGCGSTAQGANWPEYTLLGGPAPSGQYESQVALSDKAQNPYLFEEAQFSVTITNSVFNPSNSAPPVTNVRVGFGTGPGMYGSIPYRYGETPDPDPLLPTGIGLGLILIAACLHKKSDNRKPLNK